MRNYSETIFANSRIYIPQKKYPLCFVLACLFFIYMLQYPLYQLLDINSAVGSASYSVEEWLIAYGFILASAAVFVAFLYVGMIGKPVSIDFIPQKRTQTRRRISLPVVVIMISLFSLLTYLMLNLKIGITIYSDVERLPFKLVGLLVYGRMFLQPLVLAYIANGYSNSKFKMLVFLMMIALGAWISLASGSRFLGILYSLPILLLFKGRIKYVVFGVVVLAYILIATVSRSYYLAPLLGEEYVQIYSNAVYQSALIDNVYWLPIHYIVARTMGIAETLMTLNYGSITPSVWDSLLSFFSYFTQFVPYGDSVSIKNIYGLSDDAIGGFGLDIFSNYWVYFGGDPLLYFFGLALVAWMMGKAWRLLDIALCRAGFNEGSIFIFIMLFFLAFEGRAFLFPGILLVSWFLSRRNTTRILRLIFEHFSQNVRFRNSYIR